MSEPDSTNASLRLTPLNALHRELGAKLVPFAGYEMPLQYAAGIVKEHNHVRAAAGLFDVSHMGQARLEADFETAAAALEALTPADFLSLKPGRIRYTQLVTEEGGIIDDLMVTRPPDGQALSLVVNASRQDIDFAHLRAHLPASIALTPHPERALLALQGPKAASVLPRAIPGVERLSFMESGVFEVNGDGFYISRSGYTGEDGYEISVPAASVEAFARRLLAEPEVLPIGLGARDTLRLEVCYPLHGHELRDDLPALASGVSWAIKMQKVEFVGREVLLREKERGLTYQLVGLEVTTPGIVRADDRIFVGADNVGWVTSGTKTPTLNKAVALAYVKTEQSAVGNTLEVEVRGKRLGVIVVNQPFLKPFYKR